MLDKPDIIANGFKRAGLSPWNTNAPDKAKLLPGTIFQASDVPAQVGTPQLMEDNNACIMSTTADQILDIESMDIDINHQTMESPAAQDNVFPDLEIDMDIQTLAATPKSSPPLVELDVTSTPDLDCTPHSNTSDQLIEFDTTPQCNQVDDQPLSEVTPKPFWYGKTQICPNCDKRVLGRLMQRHSESCKPVQISSNSQTSPLKISKTVLESVPEFSLDDRITHLNKFEVLLLTRSK